MTNLENDHQLEQYSHNKCYSVFETFRLEREREKKLQFFIVFFIVEVNGTCMPKIYYNAYIISKHKSAHCRLMKNCRMLCLSWPMFLYIIIIYPCKFLLKYILMQIVSDIATLMTSRSMHLKLADSSTSLEKENKVSYLSWFA